MSAAADQSLYGSALHTTKTVDSLDAEGAQERSGYIKSLQSGMQSLGSEYHFQDGGLLLRVNGDLTATQAEKYEAAFRKRG